MRQYYHFAKGLNESSPVGPRFTIKVNGYYAKSKLILRNTIARYLLSPCVAYCIETTGRIELVSILYNVYGNSGTSKIRILSFETFPLTLDLDNFASHGRSIIISIKLADSWACGMITPKTVYASWLDTHTLYFYYKPFIGFWQPRKAGLNKHAEKSCIHNIHKITSLEMI